jgi:D-alanyl-D-alanine carboxypeptidase
MLRQNLIVLSLCLSFVAAGAHAQTAAPARAEPAAAEIDRLLAGIFPSNAPGAAVLVMHNNQVLLRKGYGLADLELGVPMDPTDVLRLCSITKQFTAVAILQLVEAGKLKLDDDITNYVPDCPTGGNKITLTHLLTHTSGLPSIDEQPQWLKAWRQDLTLTQILDFTRGLPPDFPPGSDWKYSNTGYILLGAVIEKVSGQSYAQYIQSHIFTPAGMTDSYYANDNRIIPRRVPGYSRDGKQWANAPYFSMTQTFSAGALLSTVDDLWKWEQALQEGKLVSLALLAKAYTQGHLPDGRPTRYGFGWQLGSIGSHATVEHGGGIPGFAAYELRVADAGLYIAILCNTNEPHASLPTLSTRPLPYPHQACRISSAITESAQPRNFQSRLSMESSGASSAAGNGP